MKSYDLVQHLLRQRAFSKQAFGPAKKVSGRGGVAHIRKELEEIEEHLDLLEDIALRVPDAARGSRMLVREFHKFPKQAFGVEKADLIHREIRAREELLIEWIDVVLLALDGAWRSGFDPEEVAAALERKQSINENREWPDWRLAEEGQPIEHIRKKTGT